MNKVAAMAVAASASAMLIFPGVAAAATDARCASPVKQYQPPKGMVPNKVAAAEISRTYLVTIYGRADIESELPLRASLQRGVWLVQGTGNTAPGSKGGVAMIEICKSNGRVLSVIHEK